MFGRKIICSIDQGIGTLLEFTGSRWLQVNPTKPCEQDYQGSRVTPEERYIQTASFQFKTTHKLNFNLYKAFVALNITKVTIKLLSNVVSCGYRYLFSSCINNRNGVDLITITL